MDTQQLIEQLRRAADALEAIAAGETPAIQPGDVAQVRQGHGEHAGRLVIVTRRTTGGLRAAIVEARHNAAWGTDIDVTAGQLAYIGTPARQTEEAQRLTNSEQRRASLRAVQPQFRIGVATTEARPNTKPPRSRQPRPAQRTDAAEGVAS